MEFFRGLLDLSAQHRGCVASIGNFDGMHRGHQAVIARLREEGVRHAVPVTLMIFEPQPQEYFHPEQAPARLMRTSDKCLTAVAAGVDRILCLRFDARLASLSAEKFIDDILVTRLGVKHLVVGDDFRFGKNRAGNFAQLTAAGRAAGFSVESMPRVDVDGARVSSTRVREALAAGELDLATRLLGRPYRISGRVIHGDRRGRTIGVPTANIPLRRRVLPVRGVFIVSVHGLANHALTGVANIGTRPTVDGTRALLEVHVFDFKQEIYGRRIHVDFLHKLRDEQRFASFTELQQRIATDLDEARSWLRRAG